MTDFQLWHCELTEHFHNTHTEALLCRIANLLQQLVDNGAAKQGRPWTAYPYKCIEHGLGWDTYEEATLHWVSSDHAKVEEDS